MAVLALRYTGHYRAKRATSTRGRPHIWSIRISLSVRPPMRAMLRVKAYQVAGTAQQGLGVLESSTLDRDGWNSFSELNGP